MKTLTVTPVNHSANLLCARRQIHCLFLATQKGSVHSFLCMLKGNHCRGTKAPCAQNTRYLYQRDTVTGGIRNKAGKTQKFRRGKSFRTGTTLKDLQSLSKDFMRLSAALAREASRKSTVQLTVAYLHVCSARTLGTECTQGSLLCHRSKEFPVETRG